MSENPTPGELGERLRSVREERYGADGGVVLAGMLGIDPGTLSSYEEIGELAPAQVLLRFIELTGVDPLWLIHGEGGRYRRRPTPASHASDSRDGGPSRREAD